jgi:hypothetical protein
MVEEEHLGITLRWMLKKNSELLEADTLAVTDPLLL